LIHSIEGNLNTEVQFTAPENYTKRQVLSQLTSEFRKFTEQVRQLPTISRDQRSNPIDSAQANSINITHC